MRDDGFPFALCCLISFAFKLGLSQINLTPENPEFLLLLFPIIYKNAKIQKTQILDDNKNKSGIYRWINQTNARSYIGSAVNLQVRFKDYFSVGYLKRQLLQGRSIIYSSLLKNGFENFNLEILEYCPPEKCLEREDYYLELLNPKYNICSKAGSSLGRKTNEDAKMKLSIIAKKRKYIPNPGLKVQVTDLDTNVTSTYDSIRKAADALKSDIKTILRREKNQINKPYRGRYIIKILRN